MKNARVKDFFREIRKSISRYMSILLIVALGVAFFSGVRSSEPDMKLSADAVADEANLMDIRVLSTMGLTDSDIDSIRDVDGVTDAAGEYSADVLAVLDDAEVVLHFASLTDGINTVTLTEGRMPQAPDECLVDADMMMSVDYEIGDEITVSSGTGDDILDTFNADTFTIVGICQSPYYLDFDRGTTTIGNGSVRGFVLVQPEAFCVDYYTQVYVTADSADEYITGSDDYQAVIDEITERIEAIADGRCEVRLAEIKADAQAEIDDAQAEYDEAKADAEAELADAKKEIEDAEKELADGEAELADAEKELADGREEIEDAEKELADGRAELAEKEAELAAGEAELAAAEAELAAAKEEAAAGSEELSAAKEELAEKQAELSAAKEELEAGAAELSAAKEEAEAGAAELSAAKEELEARQAELSAGAAEAAAGEEALTAAEAKLQEQEAALEALKNIIVAQGKDPGDDAAYMTLKATLEAYEVELAEQKEILDEAKEELKYGEEQLAAAGAEIEKNEAELDAALEAIEVSEAELDAARKAIEEGEAELNAAQKVIEESEAELSAGQKVIEESETELAAAQAEISDGKAQIAAARAEIESGEEELIAARIEADDGEAEIEDARAELADAKEEIAAAWEEYEEGSAEADEELAEAQAEIDDAQAEADELELPEWYVLDRNSIKSYVSIANDAESVGAIGTYFPLIFFLVAALMSLTTMTRMVEEQRTEIGTLKALGYTTFSIALKYVGYAFTASIIGGVIGFLIGEKIFPLVIIIAYKILYVNLTIVKIPYNWGYAIAATAISVVCTAGAALGACYSAARSEPADLMRPAAPKVGKKIFLEHVPILWKHLNFSWKSTLRNIFRYKGRMLMTIFGIGTCMALVIVGLGIRDSVYVVSDKQYGELWTYDAYLTIDGDDDEIAAFMDDLAENDMVTASMTGYLEGLEGEANGVSDDVYVVVPKDEEVFPEFFALRDRKTQEVYTLDDEGAIISEKLAKELGLSIGDTFILKESETDRITVRVSNINENYVYKYVYMTPDYYEQVYGKPAEYNTEYLNMAETGDEAEKELSSWLLTYDVVAGVTMVSDMNQSILDMLGSLNVVIWVLVISAALLAIVVLYNLNNISITERRRELATIRVLGFYDGELAMYVYRENILLTIIGIIIGIILGKILHGFIIQTVEVGLIMFGRTVNFSSYVWAALLTVIFALIVNVTMFFKLRKIDMVESLKSVE